MTNNNSSVGQKILNMQIISLICKVCPESKYHGVLKSKQLMSFDNMNVLTTFNDSLLIRL